MIQILSRVCASVFQPETVIDFCKFRNPHYQMLPKSGLGDPGKGKITEKLQ